MIEIYKRDRDGCHYWRAWRHQRIVVLNWGKVGERGRTHQIRLKKGQAAKAVIEEAARKPIAEGYGAIDPEEYDTVVVQYQLAGWGSVDDLDRRRKIEEVLNECLASTCNGFCDGGDLGSGEMNLYCLVIDPSAVRNAIVSALKKNRFLKGAVIAVREGETYRVIWPDDFKGDFSIV
jgi:hypothetical protein